MACLSCRLQPQHRTLCAAVLMIGFNIQISMSQSLTSQIIATINNDCSACDSNFTQMVGTYQNNFLGHSNSTDSPLDVANYHCSSFASIGKCYEDCVHGYPVIYDTNVKQSYMLFYKQFCDAECSLAFLPWCYNKLNLAYNLYRIGCNEANHEYNASLISCIKTWTDVQRCSGACSSGQRALSTLLLMMEQQCRIPILADQCSTAVELCMENTFGSFGRAFIVQSPELTSSNNESCRYFGGAYVQCLSNAVSGNLTLGQKPFSITYQQPCSQYSQPLYYLSSLAQSAVQPLCNDPTSNLSLTCAILSTAVQVLTTNNLTPNNSAHTTVQLIATSPSDMPMLSPSSVPITSQSSAPMSSPSSMPMTLQSSVPTTLQASMPTPGLTSTQAQAPTYATAQTPVNPSMAAQGSSTAVTSGSKPTQPFQNAAASTNDAKQPEAILLPLVLGCLVCARKFIIYLE